MGGTVVVADSGYGVVYEFDVGRMRFRGPAPRITGPEGPVTLPGYPVRVSRQPLQQAAAVGGTVVVAGVLDGTAVLLDRDGGELAVRDILLLPLRNLDDGSGVPSNNSTGGEDRPYATLASRFGASDALVVTEDLETGLSVGYALDLAARSLLVGRQLPGGGGAQAVAPYGDAAVAVMSSRKLVVLTRGLEAAKEIALPGPPVSVAVEGDTAWVGVGEPARLVRVDLRTGATRVVASDRRDKLGGSVLVEDGTVWWALPAKGVIRRIRPSGKEHTLKACNGAGALTRREGTLFFVCQSEKALGVLRDGHAMVTFAAGSYPFSVVAPG